MYIIEFERIEKDEFPGLQSGIAVRILDPTADTPGDRLIGEKFFPGDAGDVELKAGTDYAILRIPKASTE